MLGYYYQKSDLTLKMASKNTIRIGDSRHEFWAEGTTEELTSFFALNPSWSPIHKDYTIIAMLVILLLYIITIVVHYFAVKDNAEKIWVYLCEVFMLLFAGIEAILIHKKWKNMGVTIIAIIVGIMITIVGLGLKTPSEVTIEMKEKAEEWVNKKG